MPHCSKHNILHQNSCLQKHPVITQNTFELNDWWLKWINENWVIDFLIDWQIDWTKWLQYSNTDQWTDQITPYWPADLMVVTDWLTDWLTDWIFQINTLFELKHSQVLWKKVLWKYQCLVDLLPNSSGTNCFFAFSVIVWSISLMLTNHWLNWRIQTLGKIWRKQHV